MTNPMTLGVHHVGLAVPDLDAACRFFCEARLDAHQQERPISVSFCVGWNSYPDPLASRRSRLGSGFRSPGQYRLASSGLGRRVEAALQATFESVSPAPPGVAMEFPPGPIRPVTGAPSFIQREVEPDAHLSLAGSVMQRGGARSPMAVKDLSRCFMGSLSLA